MDELIKTAMKEPYLKNKRLQSILEKFANSDFEFLHHSPRLRATSAATSR